MIGVGAISFFFAYRAQRAAQASDLGEQDAGEKVEGSENLNILIAAVLPVWRRHVESVKSQTEGSVNQLITSFSSMVKQFDMAGFGGVSGP